MLQEGMRHERCLVMAMPIPLSQGAAAADAANTLKNVRHVHSNTHTDTRTSFIHHQKASGCCTGSLVMNIPNPNLPVETTCKHFFAISCRKRSIPTPGQVIHHPKVSFVQATVNLQRPVATNSTFSRSRHSRPSVNCGCAARNESYSRSVRGSLLRAYFFAVAVRGRCIRP